MAARDGLEVTGPLGERYDEILTPEALDLVAVLHREFGARRKELLKARAERQERLSAGGTLDFLPDTAAVRADDSWRVNEPGPGLEDRRVEITGPTDRKMTINALNSGAKVWLADFEDANTPLWNNMIEGQLSLRDALDRTIDFTDPKSGKSYALKADEELATIVVRPRGWHMEEKHVLVDGEPISGSLFDFALYFFHCARRQLAKGKGPYFYLPKMESHLEARLWNDVFNLAQDELEIPRGTIRATVLIETIPAAFEMEEILYELRDHSAGLNAGRWDYLFSVIKKFRDRGADFVLPERNAITMTAPFMRAYTELLVRTCHKRGAHAIGGMAAFIPSRKDAEVNKVALEKVRADKTRESGDGFDGSWVAHPDLVPVCREVFDGVLGDKPNQRDRLREDVKVSAADLLNIKATPGDITEAGLRGNVDVALRYLATWLDGAGAVAIHNLMEDAATAEISRSQVWQWIYNGVATAEGQKITKEWVEQILDEELAKIRAELGDAFNEPRYNQAVALFKEVTLADEYSEFLTTPAYVRFP
ncbi:malate synthase A [Actinomadura rayongensis]|uniref:Malate synthase n=1 Tax=Actinomadura rayongensis TaxID=1429076 RepID=A0A6I4W0B0_9ACTN|nr:malate synthase A [Actinomadura rayongensis]MXQ63677.1 malate synthase A [Actinomadura rayongensis]